MKHADIINQIRAVAPKYTNRFNDVLSVSTATATADTATIVTSVAHGLTTNDAVTFRDWQFENVITNVSQDGLVFTFTTTSDHDLTEGYHEKVTLQGFTDSNWNGEFDLFEVPNRQTFRIRSTNSIPSPDSDSALMETLNTGLVGLFGITVIDTTTFTVSGSFKAGSYFNGDAVSGIRIYGSVDVDRMIEVYTEQGLSDYWICVVMNDSDISKSTYTDTDASAVFQTNANVRMKLLNTFTVFVIVNASDQSAGVISGDVCRGELLFPILKSLLGVKFDTYLSQEAQYKTTFLGHGMSIYNGAVYVHYYAFESISEVTNEDQVNADDSVAFREIDLIEHVDAPTISDDVETMTVTVDLDDEPLP